MIRRGDTEEAPYMGTVQISRVTGNVALFDSEARHQHFIALRINTADRRRDLSRDLIHDTGKLIEVYMTEAQFASMITSLNMGSGTPCTLNWIKGEGSIRGPEHPENRIDLFHDEMLDRLQSSIESLMALKETPGISKKNQGVIDGILTNLKSNTGFVASQFGDHMDHHMAKSKAEIEAYMNAIIQRAGLAALGAPDTEIADKIADTSRDHYTSYAACGGDVAK